MSLVIIILTIFSCYDLFPNHTLNRACEYNPQKAGAFIQSRYDMEQGIGVRYIDNKFYLLKRNEIVVLEIADNSFDVITITKKIKSDINSLIFDISSVYECGITVQNDTITTLLRTSHLDKTTNLYNLKYTFLETDINNELTHIAGSPFGLSDTEQIRQIYFNNSNNKLYTLIEDSELTINEYVLTNKTLLLNNSYTPQKPNLILSKNGYFYIESGWTAGFVENNNTIGYYQCANQKSDFTIDLRYLNLKNPPLSVFSDDDGNIWLYVCENNKYELLKLKLM